MAAVTPMESNRLIAELTVPANRHSGVRQRRKMKMMSLPRSVRSTEARKSDLVGA
jgi:hypothetical protein